MSADNDTYPVPTTHALVRLAHENEDRARQFPGGFSWQIMWLVSEIGRLREKCANSCGLDAEGGGHCFYNESWIDDYAG